MIYDLAIIGGGPAGYTAAERAGKAGLKTIVFEEKALGGVCLHSGCIPTKTMLASAKIQDHNQHANSYGVVLDESHIDHPTVLKRKQRVVKALSRGVEYLIKSSGVECVNETARIKGKTEQGYEIEADSTCYQAKNILISTGSTPIIPPIPGLKKAIETGVAVTSDQILDVQQLPERLVIIGAGVIGIEFACYHSAAGVQVTIIERLERIGGQIDPDISAVLKTNLEKQGISIHVGAEVIGIDETTVSFRMGEEKKSIQTDMVLVSVGRGPRTKHIGLQAIGGTGTGPVETDDRMQTVYPGIYAAGDVVGRSQLAHTAYREAEVAVATILGQEDTIDYEIIPNVIYSNPEVASVGMTEIQATERGIDFVSKSISLNYSGRYMAEQERGDGIAKIIVDKGTRQLVGFHMIGNYASEVVQSATILITHGITIDQIKRTVFAHPTLSEIIREAVLQV